MLDGFSLEPGVLAGKTLLDDLELHSCVWSGGATGLLQLMSDLQEMQELTYMKLDHSLNTEQFYTETAPAPAYAALTASSKLDQLNISECTLPEGAWQYIFPTTGPCKLPHLQQLCIGGVSHA
jgi:hypothetical protein